MLPLYEKMIFHEQINFSYCVVIVPTGVPKVRSSDQMIDQCDPTSRALHWILVVIHTKFVGTGGRPRGKPMGAVSAFM